MGDSDNGIIREKITAGLAKGMYDSFKAYVEENPEGVEMKGIAYGQLTAVLTKAIQEQQTLIESLTDRIAALENN